MDINHNGSSTLTDKWQNVCIGISMEQLVRTMVPVVKLDVP